MNRSIVAFVYIHNNQWSVVLYCGHSLANYPTTVTLKLMEQGYAYCYGDGCA